RWQPWHSKGGVRETAMNLEEIKQVAVPACEAFRVKRLDLFGSLARGEGTSKSDVDLLVEFEEPDLHPSKRFFGLLHYLEDALGCDVDLLTINGLKNPYFRRNVLKARVNVYGG
ncbi:nucleotidyltransferase family protein, partial [Candidatus Entotheonella palauensis]